MKVEYDKYYQTENLFGAPYPELIEFYKSLPERGQLLDLGCGQGRDAIALARLGYDVLGVDYSKVGIEQLNEIAKRENLKLIGIVADIYKFSDFDQFDFILLDSMFHFGKMEKQKEVQLLKRVINASKPSVLITICIQNIGKKLKVLNAVFSEIPNLKIIKQEEIRYKFEDKKTNHSSETKYKIITLQKQSS